MSEEKKTKQKLLEAARNEFMEKGYNKASLRSICRKAEVTTGALYFFFKDKEDLFGAFVDKPIEKLATILKEHFLEEKEELNRILDEKANFSHDNEVFLEIVDVLYDNFDDIYLLLEKSEGSRYATIVDRYVEEIMEHTRRISSFYAKVLGKKELDERVLHWLSHVQIESYVYLIEHSIKREDAYEYAKIMTQFLTDGWAGLFKQK